MKTVVLKRIALAAAGFALTAALASGALANVDVRSGTATFVVDRDGVECPNADFASIQAAVDAAQPGDLIRVCPDLYNEGVVVDKPLTLKGDPDAIETIDCFQPTPVELADDQLAIVDPAGEGFSIAFKLEADNVDLGGFVVQGATVGIDTSDRFSGYRIHHNLMRSNALFGVDFGSEGTRESRVDHNCIRDPLPFGGELPSWGLVTELDDDSLWKLSDGPERDAWNARDLLNARIDHNATFRNRVGLDVGGPGRHDDITFDHNASQDDRIGIALQNSKRSRIVHNVASPILSSIFIGGATVGLVISANQTQGGQNGIVFSPPGSFLDAIEAPSTGAFVTGNTISGKTLDGIVAAPGRLYDSVLESNVSSDNGRDGIALRLGNAGNVVRGNVADRNDRNGIYAQGAVGNVFEANSMSANGVSADGMPPRGFDARDDNRTTNTWIATDCVTDFPAGTICGVNP
jgi:parallel beta-helix repeat protein